MGIRYDGKHIIVFGADHEQAQEGWRLLAWIELAGGVRTNSVLYGLAPTKEQATESA